MEAESTTSGGQPLAPPDILRTRRVLVVLGVPIDDLTMPEALARIDAFVNHGRRSGRSHQIATVNADFAVKALEDPELRYLLQQADMATADGMPLVWGARLLGVPLKDRVTGADLVPALAERAAEQGYSLYFLGARPGVAARAAEILKERYPDLHIAGVQAPPFSPVLDMDEKIADQIRAASPDILLVAFGNPKQEKWIGMHGAELGVPVMIGVGGTLDFIAGETRRAPRWMQRIGLEWAHRLLQEPRRMWQRYVRDLWGFSTFFVRQWWAMRRAQAPAMLPTSELLVLQHAANRRSTAILNLEGHVDVAYNPTLRRLCAQALEVTPNLVVNLAQARFLDSAAIGTLITLAKEADSMGGAVRLASVPPQIRQTLRLLRLDRLFLLDDSLEEALMRKVQPVATTNRADGKWTVVSLPRRLDAHSVPQVETECEALLAQQTHLVMDFSHTDFLTSAGLALLVRLQRRMQAKDGAVRLAGCSDDVKQVLTMVRFDRAFDIYEDVAEAAATTNAANDIPVEVRNADLPRSGA